MLIDQKHRYDNIITDIKRTYANELDKISKLHSNEISKLKDQVRQLVSNNESNIRPPNEPARNYSNLQLIAPPVQTSLSQLRENEYSQTRARKSFIERLKLIPVFKGESYKTLQEFIGVSDTLFASISNNAEQDEFIQTIFLKLRNEAARIINYNNPNWNEIKQDLLNEFSHLLNKSIINSTLENLRQGNSESLIDYAQRTRQCLNEKLNAYQIITPEQKEDYDRLARKAFARGIIDAKLRDRLFTRGSNSLQDSIAYAIDAENETINNIHSSELFCKYCKTIGHREKDCRKKQNQSGIGQLINALQSTRLWNNNSNNFNSSNNFNRQNNNNNFNNQSQNYNNQNWNQNYQNNNRDYSNNNNNYNQNNNRNYQNDNRNYQISK
ncbi:myb-like protein I [Sitodiplosis mosellana]|uniref:myb-like protein I n=1 Tax=Sitodiplosis mosellana TaxID=263140 RepID=UPI002443861E|nr:myb-like protein I [Sitodiplosis mosellana]